MGYTRQQSLALVLRLNPPLNQSGRTHHHHQLTLGQTIPIGFLRFFFFFFKIYLSFFLEGEVGLVLLHLLCFSLRCRNVMVVKVDMEQRSFDWLITGNVIQWFIFCGQNFETLLSFAENEKGMKPRRIMASFLFLFFFVFF